MEVLRLELNHAKSLVLNSFGKPKNMLIAVSGVGASYFVYLTIKLYRKKRRYRHIPGPPTRGYIFIVSLLYLIIL